MNSVFNCTTWGHENKVTQVAQNLVTKVYSDMPHGEKVSKKVRKSHEDEMVAVGQYMMAATMFMVNRDLAETLSIEGKDVFIRQMHSATNEMRRLSKDIVKVVTTMEGYLKASDWFRTTVAINNRDTFVIYNEEMAHEFLGSVVSALNEFYDDIIFGIFDAMSSRQDISTDSKNVVKARLKLFAMNLSCEATAVLHSELMDFKYDINYEEERERLLKKMNEGKFHKVIDDFDPGIYNVPEGVEVIPRKNENLVGIPVNAEEIRKDCSVTAEDIKDAVIKKLDETNEFHGEPDSNPEAAQ